ncbi:Root cap [Dillenia turbinata]|uniref:Root cap n=1 Tax=Dillenia turbinata TaxID=194707 RepID=A0AAN8Z1P8_9MAGN
MSKVLSLQGIVVFVLLTILLGATELEAASSKSKVKPVKQETVTCKTRHSRCFLKKIKCPKECPKVKPSDPKAKACFLDCYSPKCEAVCRYHTRINHLEIKEQGCAPLVDVELCKTNMNMTFFLLFSTARKPNCKGTGAACYDPRFIGGDGIVFYFHGRSNEDFALISDTNFQINARFIGHRPIGRSRDYTWIQGLGLMFGTYNFTIEARKASKWDSDIDHLKFSYNGEDLIIPEGHLTEWNSLDSELQVERTSSKNSALIVLQEKVEISVNVVPVTELDNKIHNYQLPLNDSFAHLEVQFRFFGLSPKVDGVLGRTYRPDFVNPAKPGVAMPVVGGADKYRTSSLLSADCLACVFSSENMSEDKESSLNIAEYGMLDCTSRAGGESGILCRK